MKVTICGRTGSKWTILNERGEAVYIGKTRKSCFVKCFEMGWKIVSYNNGAK